MKTCGLLQNVKDRIVWGSIRVLAFRYRIGYELASRLSCIVRGGPPDKELMRAAGAGELAERHHVEAQVKRMAKAGQAEAFRVLKSELSIRPT